jgi:plasmid stability protein
MNVTLSIDERLLARARTRAAALGKSLNQLVRDYLEHVVGDEDPERDLAELERLSASSGGRSRGKRISRDELHARS